MTYDSLKTVTLKLLDYCQANDWKGYDPYDALNSPALKYLPLLNFRLPRIALTQILKRSPLNFRPLLLIPKTENPKALALFLMAFLKLKRLGLLEDEDLVTLMIQKLVNLRSPTNLQPLPARASAQEGVTRNLQLSTHNSKLITQNSYCCWGYSFPWQTRTIIVPRGAPNLVCTTIVANALLDAYELGYEGEISFGLSEAGLKPSTFDTSCLDMAVNAANYIVDKLYWSDGDSVAGFCYPLPALQARVHNANFLGAALLCRVYKFGGEKKFLKPALKVARYSATKQHEDGSWDYGESSTQRWVDNFHTGYDLCALRAISEYAETPEFEFHIRRGFEFYRKHLFREDGAAKYFHDRAYPIDIHSVAQSIITVLAFKDFDENNVSLAHSAFEWAMTHMWDEQGYFYYQVLPSCKNKIPYMRWSQAWMLLALAHLLEQSHAVNRC
jgi:hypothetical protein